MQLQPLCTSGDNQRHLPRIERITRTRMKRRRTRHGASQGSDNSSPESAVEKCKLLKMSGQSRAKKAEQPATLEQIRGLFEDQAKRMEDSEARIKEAMSSMREELNAKIEKTQQENEALKAENIAIKGRLTALEREARKLNIVASGIEFESPFEGLKLLNTVIEKSTGKNLRLKGLRTFDTKTGKKIVAECATREDKTLIMENKRNMSINNKPVYVDDDLPKEDRASQQQIRQMAKKLREEGKSVKIARNRLKVDDKWFALSATTNELEPTTFRTQGPASFLERPRAEDQNPRN